ncbi:unannotated protein [freshwater metagenome]|uniref:Unannotated protein n=1 Tax=freshwater metagenome TaxID=449393 RepID=A0A6J7C7U1_9ZZZZ
MVRESYNRTGLIGSNLTPDVVEYEPNMSTTTSRSPLLNTQNVPSAARRTTVEPAITRLGTVCTTEAVGLVTPQGYTVK